MKLTVAFLILLLPFSLLSADAPPPAPLGPIPSEIQLAWQEMEYYAFVHFSLNTYTDRSWGFGDEKLALFNPANVDCREWARVCKNAGMKGIILTAKHHCGFCLWPSEFTDYSVKNTPWRNGKGDLVRELSDACREYGLKFGIYLSPWDRHRSDYGSPSYIAYFRNQLTELLTRYGPIFEVWFDGANGGTGYYGGANEERKIDRTTYYDWANTYALVRKLQPKIVIWNDGGDRGDLRWVGTEAGFVGETNWSLLNGKGEVTWPMLHHGLEDGDSWVPAEVNTSIRPEWFYHPSEDTKVKTLPQLVDTYYHSIGRNATLLLNFPITPDGKIHPHDEKAALDLAAVIQESFKENLALSAKMKASNIRGNDARFGPKNLLDKDLKTFWATDDEERSANLTFTWEKPVYVNRLLVQEAIALGQRVKSFVLEARLDGAWKPVCEGTTIGYKRILRFPSVLTDAVRFRVLEAKGCPTIATIGVFNAPVLLDAPRITRNQAGMVSLASSDIGPEFHFTTDGTEPTKASSKFMRAFDGDGKITVKAIAVDPSTGATSTPAIQAFDISRRDWKILSPVADEANKIIDGDAATVCHLKPKTLPSELVIDLGAAHPISGFSYTPDTGQWDPGIISHYAFLVSTDGITWATADSGEFPNIKNNPVPQERRFKARTARFIKLVALKVTDDSSVVGFGDFGVFSE